MKGRVLVVPNFVNCRLSFVQDGTPGLVDPVRGAARVQLMENYGLLPERNHADCGLYGLGLDREEAEKVRKRVFKGFTQRTVLVPFEVFDAFRKEVKASHLCKELVIKTGQLLPVLDFTERATCPDVAGRDVLAASR